VAVKPVAAGVVDATEEVVEYKEETTCITFPVAGLPVVTTVPVLAGKVIVLVPATLGAASVMLPDESPEMTMLLIWLLLYV